jgi:hypothetical protein
MRGLRSSLRLSRSRGHLGRCSGRLGPAELQQHLRDGAVVADADVKLVHAVGRERIEDVECTEPSHQLADLARA